MTAGGFISVKLLDEELKLKLPSFNDSDANEIRKIAVTLANQSGFPITVQVQISGCSLYNTSIEELKPENGWWIRSKVAVVLLRRHLTMYERVSEEVRSIDWHKEYKFRVKTCTIQGGAIPFTTNEGFKGILTLVALQQVGVVYLKLNCLLSF